MTEARNERFYPFRGIRLDELVRPVFSASSVSAFAHALIPPYYAHSLQ
jgi:hypothetical protein